jgi:CelD/BcsL family acetyltransferase involved in cellulose biosynthesis
VGDGLRTHLRFETSRLSSGIELLFGDNLMSAIHWLSADDLGEWDAFATRHPLGLVYHLSAWQRVIESAFRHIRGRFLVVRDGSGKIQAGLPVYTVSSWLLGNRTVSVPFATMCDPLVSTKEEFDLLWPAVEDTCERHRSRRIEIRTRRLGPDCMPAFLTGSVRYKHHYLPLGMPEDALFRSFDKTTIRQRMGKARREGVVVEERQDEQSLRALHAMLGATRQRRSLPPMPFAFFQAMHRWLRPDHVALYLAMQAGEPVGGLLALKFKDQWTAEYSGVVDHAIPGISPLLFWETIQRAKSSGAAGFSFGRTSLDNTGLLAHKRRWATIEEDLTDFIHVRGCKSIQDQEPCKTDSLTRYRSALQLLLRHAPAAAQKLIGDLCYRHLG